MFTHELKYELIGLLRSRWIQLLSALLLLLCLFAAYNGRQKVDQRLAAIASAQQEVKEGDARALMLLDSIEAGLPVNVSSWQMPDKPATIGNYYPRVAYMAPKPLALFSSGQSDMFTHYVKPSMRGEAMMLNFTEMTNPVQLLFGSFDLAFVFIYLLPLIVIAFTYDLLSKEREQGSLRLIAAQPLSLLRWLWQKLLVRILVLGTLLSLALLLSLGLQGALTAAILPDLLLCWLLSLAYMIFWFALAFLINLLGQSSSQNAVSMLSLWVLFVLLIPAVVAQLGNSLYPVPSRAGLVNELRLVTAEVNEKADDILSNFLRDHPELASEEAQQAGFWQRYLASQRVIQEEIRPVLNTYEAQLAQQQQWTQRGKLLSPALLLQDSFNELSGTSNRHYEHFRTEVIRFAEDWRAFFMPLIFKNQPVDARVMADLPTFTYTEAGNQVSGASNLLVILAYVLLVVGGGFAYFRRQGLERVLT